MTFVLPNSPKFSPPLFCAIRYVDFKGLPNCAKFILIDHCVDNSINEVSSECKHTIAIAIVCGKQLVGS